LFPFRKRHLSLRLRRRKWLSSLLRQRLWTFLLRRLRRCQHANPKLLLWLPSRKSQRRQRLRLRRRRRFRRYRLRRPKRLYRNQRPHRRRWLCLRSRRLLPSRRHPCKRRLPLRAKCRSLVLVGMHRGWLSRRPPTSLANNARRASRVGIIPSARTCTRVQRLKMDPSLLLLVVLERRRRVDVRSLERRTSLVVEVRKAHSRDAINKVVAAQICRHVRRRNTCRRPLRLLLANRPTRLRRFRHAHRRLRKRVSTFGRAVQVCQCRLRNSAPVRHDEPRTIRVLRLRRRVPEPRGSDKLRVLGKVVRHVDQAVTNVVVRADRVDSVDVRARPR
jgi:hypothetical protein